MKPAGGRSMSEIADYIKLEVQRYIDNETDIDTFRGSIVGAYVYARNQASEDGEANLLVSALMLPYAEFSAGHRSEHSLRRELANALRPFVASSTITVLKVNLSRSWFLASSRSAGSMTELVGAAPF